MGKVQQFVAASGDVLVVNSGNRSRPRYRAIAVAMLVIVLLTAASVTSTYYWRQSSRALGEANALISELIEVTADTVQPNAQLENVDALLEKVRKAIDGLAVSSSDAKISEQRARTFLIFAEIDFDRGRMDRMREDAEVAFAALDPLAKSGNIEAIHLRAQAKRLIGGSLAGRGNAEEAKQHYDRAIADLNELLKRNVDQKISWRWMRSLADLQQSLGDLLLLQFNQREEALAAFNKARDLRERLVELGYQGPALDHDIAWIANKRADVEERMGNIDGALNLYTEAQDRMESLKERIWDNLRWATDFGIVQANIGRIKRKQNRFTEAAPIFGKAEDILLLVTKRDPKNIDRSAMLNWVRFLRAENLSRVALQNSDRIRLLSAREQMQQVIAATAEITREAPRLRAQLNKVREEALLAAIDANLRQMNGNYETAATGFIEAADMIANSSAKDGAKMPSPDMLRDNIEYLEWAGGAYVKGKRPADAQAMFKRAFDLLMKNRQVFAEKEFAEFRSRIEVRLDRSPPPAEKAPPTAEREPSADGNPVTGSTRPAADVVKPPQQ